MTLTIISPLIFAINNQWYISNKDAYVAVCCTTQFVEFLVITNSNYCKMLCFSSEYTSKPLWPSQCDIKPLWQSLKDIALCN